MFARSAFATANTASNAARTFATLSGRDAVIVGAARTPIASIGGSLASVQTPALGAAAIAGAINKAGMSAEEVQEVFMGNVCSAGIGQAPARQAALAAGLSIATPCTTVNKVCASGMKTVMFAAQSVMAGAQDCVVAGGMESMSNVPYYIPRARYGYGYGHGELQDGLIKDGLWDVYNDFHMGMCGEKCATDYSFSREDQDAYALESYRRAAAAWDAGKFDNEVVPVDVKVRGGVKQVTKDEEYLKVNTDKVPQLRPAFRKDGTVTAANASSLNDGASAVVVMSADKAAALGLTPLARIRGFGDAAHEPENFATAPAKAVPRALAMAGVTAEDCEYHEINEAFSVVSLVNMQLLGLPHDRVNVNGGAVALGHPIGSSGCRVIVSLLSILEQNDATLGTASICNGGGGASAIVIERL